jgi:3-methyladenine DNA glycosylase AlkD
VAFDVDAAVRGIDEELRAAGSGERAERERAYLKSALTHYGVGVPAIRAVARRVRAEHPGLGHDDLVAVVRALWERPVHELRFAGVELLDAHHTLLTAADAPFVEGLLRRARTWALVDGLASSVVGKVVSREPAAMGPVLDRWAVDEDFWLRRSALLALLVPLRAGGGDFERFGRYADAMLEEREFFVRKAIGWVLRDTARKRPDLVAAWLLPRAARASGVTIREAVKRLPDAQRAAILAARSPEPGVHNPPGTPARRYHPDAAPPG